ncbi:hypothetical protein HY638_01635 [Candidatus Woesearchaeota archaeon]|nr:hypothetical protein [Candidatus Woesearchaeota archaeon]
MENDLPLLALPSFITTIESVSCATLALASAAFNWIGTRIILSMFCFSPPVSRLSSSFSLLRQLPFL